MDPKSEIFSQSNKEKKAHFLSKTFFTCFDFIFGRNLMFQHRVNCFESNGTYINIIILNKNPVDPCIGRYGLPVYKPCTKKIARGFISRTEAEERKSLLRT